MLLFFKNTNNSLIYGGETTLGSMDNISRDIISRISKVHLVSNKNIKLN